MFSVITKVGVFKLYPTLKSADAAAIESQNIFSNTDTVIEESFKNGISRRFYIKPDIWTSMKTGDLNNDVTILTYIDPSDITRTRKAYKRAATSATSFLNHRGWY